VLVKYNNLYRLNLRFFRTGGVWQRKGDRVLLAIAIMLVYQNDLWKPGMAITGKHLRSSSYIVGQLLINPSSTNCNNPSLRLFRCPLKDLFPVKDILANQVKCEKVLHIYRMVQSSRENDP